MCVRIILLFVLDMFAGGRQRMSANMSGHVLGQKGLCILHTQLGASSCAGLVSAWVDCPLASHRCLYVVHVVGVRTHVCCVSSQQAWRLIFLAPVVAQLACLAMAFASSQTLYNCFICNAKFKWFKMMESENPDTWVQQEPQTYEEAIKVASSSAKRTKSASEQDAAAGAPAEVSKRGFPADVRWGSAPAGADPNDPDLKWLRYQGTDNITQQGKSLDEKSADPECVDGTGMRRRRVCTACELAWRERMPPVPEKENWATHSEVVRDLKRANRGENWCARGMAYAKSIDIVEKIKKDEGLSHREAARRKTAECKRLAEALVKVIKSGVLFDAFMNAGKRLKMSQEMNDKLNKAYDKYLDTDCSDEALVELERLEDEMGRSLDYQAANGDTKILKALDFHNGVDDDDQSSSGFHIFDVCKAKHGCGTVCGLYMPGILWSQPNKENFRFYCRTDWQAAVTQEDGEKLHTMLQKKYGKDPRSWPSFGCGAKFCPWKRGASKVVELKVDGQWHAILAERLPEQLDDEIKKLQFAFHQACGRVTADDILKAVPLTFPKCHVVDESLPVLARFDFEKWERLGKPTLTTAGWIALCRTIALKDAPGLHHIISLCDTMSPPPQSQDQRIISEFKGALSLTEAGGAK